MPDYTHNDSDPREVLLVDDDAALRGLLSVLLTQMGLRSHSARNGVEALEALHGGGSGRFCAVVTDIRMPEMGGIELGKRIRKEYPTLPILFISGYAPSMKDVEEELDEHSDFLKKPFEFNVFDKTLRALLEDQVTSPTTGDAGPGP